MENNIVNGIYIDIDSIFDTRAGVLYNISNTFKKILEESILNGSYFNRVTNEVGNIPASVIDEYYKIRDIKDLRSSIKTRVYSVFLEIVNDIIDSTLGYSIQNPVTVHLNVYPYNLSDDEKNDIINILDTDINSTICVIKIIYKDITELNMSYMDKNMSAMFMFNGLEWLEYRSLEGDLTTHCMPDVPLFIPRTSHDPVGKNNKNKFIIDFNKQMTTMSMWINIEPIDYSMYCMDLTKKEKK